MSDDDNNVTLYGSPIPSFQTTANSPLNARHAETTSANLAISGTNLFSGMVGIIRRVLVQFGGLFMLLSLR